MFAQFYTGNLFGKVVDPQKQPVTGVPVTLRGIGAPQTFVTDSQGDFRFLNLSPGKYELKAELSGFATVIRIAEVNTGANAEMTFTIDPAVAETITVTAEKPLLDVPEAGTGTVVTQLDLEHVPSARDPWVVLQSVSGLIVRELNVGGNKSRPRFLADQLDSCSVPFRSRQGLVEGDQRRSQQLRQGYVAGVINAENVTELPDSIQKHQVRVTMNS